MTIYDILDLKVRSEFVRFVVKKYFNDPRYWVIYGQIEPGVIRFVVWRTTPE